MSCKVAIDQPYITLGQLLKLADFIDSGGQAKWFLAETTVTVNGKMEHRRGKKLYPGDVVQIGQTEPIEIVQDS